MVRKRLATAVLVTGALHSGFASALGLGELTLSSALNQPFRAEIPLRDIGELDVEQIKIALADDTAFENAGVERSQFLSSLEFQVELQGGGNGRIIVTTANTVQEPYLDFIVEVRWPNGKMNREYTVLLDLPVFSQASAAPTVDVARSVTPSVAPVKPVVPSNAAPVREPGGSIGVASRVAPQVRDVDEQQRLPAAADPTEYRVQHHDTMWKIAERLRPSSYVTTQQTMLALLEKNPKAFVNGNVNRIKSGYILRIPTEAEVHKINHDEAVDEIKIQAREWRGEKVRRVSSDKKPAAAAPASTAPASAPQLDGTDRADRETIAPEEQAVKFSVGSAGSDTAASNEVDALRQKVREEQENLEKSMLENGAMQARVLEMEKQIRTLQNLITLKNTQLAALQKGLAQENGAASTADATDSAASPELPTGSEEVASSDEQVAMAALAEAGGEVLAESPEAVPSQGDVNAPSAPEEAAASTSPTSLMSTVQAWLSNSFVKFIGLGVAVLALLILILRRRSSEVENEADLAAFEASLATDDAAETDVFSAKHDNFDFDIGNTDATELSDVAEQDSEPSFSPDDFDFDNLEASEDVTADAGMDEGEITVAAVEPESVQPQTGDIVAEADIYVAYGRYDQAASLLKTAIAQDPENADLHVKLVDIYLDTRDRDNFTAAFAGLQSLGNAEAIARVKESMSAIDGVSDWLDSDDGLDTLTVADEAPADELDSELDFALDDDLDFELSDLDTVAAELDGDETTPLSNTIAIEEAPSTDDETLLAEPQASADELDVDFADTLTTEAVDEAAQNDLADSELASDGVDDSIRSAEADTLASLDVDLADLDFDFEPSSAASSAPSESDDAELDFTDIESRESDAQLDAESLTAAGAEALSDEAAESSDEDDFEFDFSAFDETDEPKTSLADASERDALTLGSANDDALSSVMADDELDLDLSSFGAENDEELLSFEADDTELDLDLADFDTPITPRADLASPTDVPSDSEHQNDALDVDDALFVDAGDGELQAEVANSELTDTDPSDIAPTGEAIAVEDLSFDEFDADEADGEFDNLLDTESVATKLDLARAYVDMGDSEGAREMLEEVLVEGDSQQQSDARALLDIIG